MLDRSDEFRRVAAQCLAVAQTTADLKVRNKLVHMAARLHNLAGDGMSSSAPQPVSQQQQQIQPKKGE